MIESVKSEDDHDLEDLGVDNGGLLPADHPLLERFQRALKEHLMKVKLQLETEIVELDHSIKAKDDEITDVGSKLFDLQNDIEIQRDQIDKYNRNILEMSDKRKTHEDNVLRLKHEFNIKDSSCKDKKRIQNELTQEIGNMHVLENEIAKWNEEVCIFSILVNTLIIITIYSYLSRFKMKLSSQNVSPAKTPRTSLVYQKRRKRWI